MEQEKIYSEKEANAFWERNKDYYFPEKEKICLKEIEKINFTPKNILDIGCAGGWHLEQLRKKFNCNCYGVDISKKAIKDGKNIFPNLNLLVGQADNLKYFKDGFFDFIFIKGVFMFIDRKKLLKSIGEIDRVLKDKGFILISDWLPAVAYKNPNKHQEGAFVYKQKYWEIFLSSYIYKLRSIISYTTTKISMNPILNKDEIDDRVYGCAIIQKDLNIL